MLRLIKGKAILEDNEKTGTLGEIVLEMGDVEIAVGELLAEELDLGGVLELPFLKELVAAIMGSELLFQFKKLQLVAELGRCDRVTLGGLFQLHLEDLFVFEGRVGLE